MLVNLVLRHSKDQKKKKKKRAFEIENYRGQEVISWS